MTSNPWWRDPDVFVDKTSAAEFTCSICQLMPQDPVELTCGGGHIFCRSCYYQWSTANTTCPTCRKYVETGNSSHAIQRFIEQNLLIQCPCCPTTMVTGKGGVIASGHEKNFCVKSPCPHCGVLVSSLNMTAHQADQCKFTCPLCNVVLATRSKTDHELYHRRQTAMVEAKAKMAEMNKELDLLTGSILDDEEFVIEHARQYLRTDSIFTISVIDHETGEMVKCKVKPTTLMSKVRKTYKDKVAGSNGAVRLYFNGEEVRASSTVAQLGLRDGSELVGKC